MTKRINSDAIYLKYLLSINMLITEKSVAKKNHFMVFEEIQKDWNSIIYLQEAFKNNVLFFIYFWRLGNPGQKSVYVYMILYRNWRPFGITKKLEPYSISFYIIKG